MHMRYLALLAALTVIPASALNVIGGVFNKLAEPLGFAKICIIGTTTCVNSAISTGAFQISTPSIVAQAPAARDFGLELRGSRASLRVPEAMRARLEWYDAGGRRVTAARDADLAAGANSVDMPEDGGRPGLRFLRLTAQGYAVTWKVLVAGGNATRAEVKPLAAAASLAKTAGVVQGIVVTRTGYKTLNYYPEQEPDTAFLFLTAANDSGFIISNSDRYTVLGIGAQELVTEYTLTGCDSMGVLVKQTFTDSLNYALRGGKLLFYYPGDCFGLQMTGGGENVRGAWTVEGWTVLPADVRPQSCGLDPLIPPPAQGITLHRFTVTDTSMIEELKGEACPGDYWVSILMPGFLSRDTAVTLNKNTCREAIFRNKAGEPATLSFALLADTIAATFVHKTATCVLKAPLQTTGDPDCSKDPEGDFLRCIVATNFVDFSQPPIAPDIRVVGKLGAPITPAWRSAFGKPLPMSRETSRPLLALPPAFLRYVR